MCPGTAISAKRSAPLFGSCATKGKGRAHWVKIYQPKKFAGGFVWRDNLDRL